MSMINYGYDLTNKNGIDLILKEMEYVKSRNAIPFLKYNMSLGKQRIRSSIKVKNYLNHCALV